MKYHLITCSIFIVFLGLSAHAQNDQAASQEEALTNEKIMQLNKIGLSQEVIKAKIASSKCNFDLSTDNLIKLKEEGLPDALITAMLSKSNMDTEKEESQYTGIYYCKGDPCEMTRLEASVYGQAKSGSGIGTALSYGIAKTKTKALMSGDHANLQIKENKPVFYFHFNKNASSHFAQNSPEAYWFGSAESPNEFVLIKFKRAKKGGREVVTGSWNYYGGISSGIKDEDKVPFKYEKIAPGQYKVYTQQSLLPGEYCFMYAGGTANVGYGSATAPLQKAYDFGITNY